MGSLRAAVVAVAWLAAGPGPTPGQEQTAPRLPDPVRTTHTSFAIPFKVAPSKSEDGAPVRVLLQVSRDLGATWQPGGEAPPGAGSIAYHAAGDGEYWFRLRAADAQGRQRGGEGPDMRVVVDAAPPRLAARVWRGADGEIVCRYAAVDDSIDMTAVAVEYRTPSDGSWKRVASEPVLSRESPAHLVGEEIWWAGEKVTALSVRITVADAAGHRTVRQFEMDASDPGVDQGALSVEIGAPPLPGQAVAATPAAPPSAEAADAVPSAPPGGWAADTGARWTDEAPAPAGEPRASSVLARPVAASVGPSPSVSAPSAPAPPPATPTLDAATPAAPLADGSVAAVPAEYRGRPLHLVRSRRFAWEYEMQVDRPDAGPVRVELWSTTDGGFTWQRTAIDEDATSPIDVQLPAPGLYGFRLEIVPDAPGEGGGPRSGENPDGWIGVDDEPPQVEFLEITREPGDSSAVLVRWEARDKLLAPASVSLHHSPNPDGPWATIAGGLSGRGEHRWIPDRGVPARVYLRAEAADVAGNVGRATTAEPVTIAVPRAVGRLGGVKPLLPGGAP